MTTFHARLSAALQRRLFPNTGLQIKQVAGAIGQDGRNLSRWINGESKPFAEATDALARFFASRGDHAFLAEVYGIEAPQPKLAAPAIVAPHADTCLWATHEGSLLEAPFGHPEFVRRYTGLPETGADEAAYAMRTIGWIALTIRGDGLITVRYAERGIDRSAAQRARDWLLEHASRITGTKRIVDIGGSHVEAFHPRAESAAEAIEGAAHLARSTETPKWQVTRRRLEEVRDERQIMLLNAYHTVPKEPGRLAAAAQDLNLLPVSNILRVEGGDVMSLWVGHDLRIAASQRMGTNVMERADLRYASMVRDRVKQATLEGPTFYHVICSIDGIPTEYDNVAVPDPANGNSRLVVTTSRVIRRPAA